MTAPERIATEGPPEEPGALERAALAFTAFSERWVPDAFAFALIATALVFGAGLAVGARPGALVDAWGGGFWSLLSFTLQMALVIISGSVLAAAAPVRRAIRRIARQPRTPRGAVAMVALFAMVTSWLNWGFSLIFSAVLAKEVARRVRGADYRALAAASFLGLGSIWAQGLSGSAALQMATAGALPAKVRAMVAAGGVVPDGILGFRHTIFLWQSLVAVAVEIVLVTLVIWRAAPTAGRARSAADLGIAVIDLPGSDAPEAPHATPGRSLNERFERSRALTLMVLLLGGAFLVRRVARPGGGIAALDLNTLNLAFLLAGFALHGTPERFLAAVRAATPSVWAVLVQFPFYAGIAGMIADTGLSERIANVFVAHTTAATFPAAIALYSMFLGVFVPSGGSKWVIEAPYVMQAAHSLKVHLGWMVAVYDLGEALANLVQPFWMLPTLALFGLRARDVMGYTFVVFVVLVPVVLALATVLGLTLHYPV